uniref:Uncharacterized protein n=1 Tax=Plectus sambesii TaxID=2011161 RepID=A0A914VN76_9BILA
MSHLKTRAFYLSGHSYAGAYIPTLTIQIIKGMKKNEFSANFQGILIGNGVMSEKRQHNTLVPIMYYHGLIGSSMWSKLKNACCPATCMTECDFWSHMVIEPSTSNYDSDNSLCGNLTWITTEFDQWGTPNDMYDIYQDCYYSQSARNHRVRGLNLIEKSISFTDGANQNYDSTDAHNGFDCWGSSMARQYLNRPDVQNAIHVNMPNFTWSSCSRFVEDNYNRSVYELDDIFDFILQNSNISILIFAGDVDLVCNFMMQELFVNDVAQKNNLILHGDRTPWMFRGRIAGYQRIFDRIHHLTVK